MAWMIESSLVQAVVLKMIKWIKKLVVLRRELPIEVSTDLILQSLLDYFSLFIINFNIIINFLQSLMCSLLRFRPLDETDRCSC